jgi:biotin carboxyl carrier protein
VAGVGSYRVRLGEQVIEIAAEGHEIEELGNGAFVVTHAGRRLRVVVAGPPDDRWVFADGRVTRVEIVSNDRRPSGRRSAAHDMSAPMPATVVNILVEPGAHVAKGDTVLMLEAMKMELPIRASRNGIVRAVMCKPGELVQPGVNLVEIEE